MNDAIKAAKKRVEAQLEIILHGLGYQTIQMGGVVHMLHTPAKVCNLVSLLSSRLLQAELVIEEAGWLVALVANNKHGDGELAKVVGLIAEYAKPLQLEVHEREEKPRVTNRGFCTCATGYAVDPDKKGFCLVCKDKLQQAKKIELNRKERALKSSLGHGDDQ